jgi:hypothetical protein
MKKIEIFALSVILLSLSSCRIIGDIFKVGVWAGVLMVVGVVMLIIFLISKIGGR